MNIGKMMKDLQKKQSKLQEEIERLEVEATAGGGVVAARMNGKKELTALTLGEMRQCVRLLLPDVEGDFTDGDRDADRDDDHPQDGGPARATG